MEISGIVLAGGTSRRLGRDKAVEPIGGEPLISRVIGGLSQVTEQTVVVMNDEQRRSVLPLPASAQVSIDVYPGKGSLGGIFSGLSQADGRWGLVVACDMPFLNLALLEHIISLRDGNDAVVPVLEGLPEPTHALYSKACLPHMERRLLAGDLKIAHVLEDVRVAFVPEDVVLSFDPEGLSFFNVNTQEDLDKALALVGKGY